MKYFEYFEEIYNMQNVVVYSFCQSFVLPFSFIAMSVVDNSCVF